MDCLKNYIHPFRGYSPQAPLSGRYLTELSGISFKSIEATANENQEDFQGLWDDLQATSADTFREDINGEFGKRYEIDQVMQSVDLDKVINVNSTSDTSKQRGLVIELFQSGMQCIGSNLSGLYIQDLNFYYLGDAVSKIYTLTFINDETKTTELTLQGNATNGWNFVNVERQFEARRLLVVLSGNMDAYVNQDISLFYLSNFYKSGWLNTGNSIMYQYAGCGNIARIRGCSYDSGTQTYVDGTDIFGVSARVATKCSFDNTVCFNKKQFVNAWMLRVGIEFLNYRINSDRINRYTTIDKQKAIDLQKLFLEKYHGDYMNMESKRYYGALQNACTSIQFNSADGCLKSNSYLIGREKLP